MCFGRLAASPAASPPTVTQGQKTLQLPGPAQETRQCRQRSGRRCDVTSSMRHTGDGGGGGGGGGGGCLSLDYFSLIHVLLCSMLADVAATQEVAATSLLLPPSQLCAALKRHQQLSIDNADTFLCEALEAVVCR